MTKRITARQADRADRRCLQCKGRSANAVTGWVCQRCRGNGLDPVFCVEDDATEDAVVEAAAASFELTGGGL